MKSLAVKELLNMGVRKVNGKKIELYSFYELCGFLKRAKQGEELK